MPVIFTYNGNSFQYIIYFIVWFFVLIFGVYTNKYIHPYIYIYSYKSGYLVIFAGKIFKTFPSVYLLFYWTSYVNTISIQS